MRPLRFTHDRMCTIQLMDALERIYCNGCRQKTRHRLLNTVMDQDTDEVEKGVVLEWSTNFETLQCCGCGAAVLRETVLYEHDTIPYVRYFPPPVSRHPPSWHYRIPKEIHPVMDEIYRSLDANNRRLPMMGARTLIDMLLVEKVGDVGTFGEKLKQLEDKGYISSRNREVLAAALDVGSAAAHRGHAPEPSEVEAVMDIVENLLHAVYVLPRMADKLKKTTPPRPSKQATTSSSSSRKTDRD
jgi:hypothetical protein